MAKSKTGMKARGFMLRQKAFYLGKLDQRFATDPQWKTKVGLATLTAGLGVLLGLRVLPWPAAVALTAAPVMWLQPFPFGREWGKEVLVVPFKLALSQATGRVPGTPGGRMWLLADLGAGRPAVQAELPDETARFWPATRISAWKSILLALATVGLLVPTGVLNAALAGVVVAYYGQVAALVHRRGTYVHNIAGMPEPDPWRLAPMWENERALPILRTCALTAGVWAIVVAGALVLAHAWFAALPAALYAALVVFNKKYSPEWHAEVAVQRGEMEQWAGNWAQLLGTRTPAPMWGGAFDLPYDAPGAAPRPKTHRMIQFQIPPGGSFDAYAAKLPEVRNLTGQDLTTIAPAPQVGPDGRIIPGTVNPSMFTVVYPHVTPENDKPFLDTDLDDTSRTYYLQAVFWRLFATAKLGQPELTVAKRLGPAARPAMTRATAGEELPPEAEAVLAGRANRARRGMAARSGNKPAAVLLETHWRFPAESLVSPAQVVAMRDKIKDALRVPYLAVGQRRSRSGDLSPELVIVVGAKPEDAHVDRAADLLFLEGLSWDTTFRACGLVGGGGRDGATPELVKRDKTPAGLEVLTFKTAGGLAVETIELKTKELIATTHKAYLEVLRAEEAGHFRIVVADFHPLDRPFKFDDYSEKVLVAPKEIPDLSWVAGVGSDDEFVIDDYDNEAPHLFIGGATKMGKSTLLNSMILQLAYKNTPDQLNFWLAEPKNELQTWQVLPHTTRFIDMATVGSDGEDISVYEALGNMLEDAVAEMERRYRWLSAQRIPGDELNSPKSLNIAYEHGLVVEPMPFIDIVVEECGDYFKPPSQKDDKPAYDGMIAALEKLCRKGRAAGIFVTALTQYPIKENLPSTAKQQMRRIGLGTADQMASLVILGVAGLEGISTRGRGIKLEGKERSGFRSFYFEGDGALTQIVKSMPTPAILDRRRKFDERGMEILPEDPAAPKPTPELPTIPGSIRFADDED